MLVKKLGMLKLIQVLEILSLAFTKIIQEKNILPSLTSMEGNVESNEHVK